MTDEQVPASRYDCDGCSFAAADRACMLAHLHTTGHASTDNELRRIADETGESIEIVRDLAAPSAAHAAMASARSWADRAQRAREAYWDGGGRFNDPDGHPEGAEAAIEVALRVRVDADLTQAVREAHPEIMIKTTELRSVIEVAFRAAGFEVEK